MVDTNQACTTIRLNSFITSDTVKTMPSRHACAILHLNDASAQAFTPRTLPNILLLRKTLQLHYYERSLLHGRLIGRCSSGPPIQPIKDRQLPHPWNIPRRLLPLPRQALRFSGLPPEISPADSTNPNLVTKPRIATGRSHAASPAILTVVSGNKRLDDVENRLLSGGNTQEAGEGPGSGGGAGDGEGNAACLTCR